MWQTLKAWIGRWRRPGGTGREADDAGAEGERLAAEFLRCELGFKIIIRNWRSPRDLRDELDLVCRDGEVLVLVEVKSRSAEALVPGYYAVNRRKKAALRRAGSAYLRALHPAPQHFRLDVVEIGTHEGRAPEIRHFANVELFAKHWRP